MGDAGTMDHVTLAEPPGPKSPRIAAWRTASRTSLVLDCVVLLLGVVLLVVALGDSVVSWPSDRVLLSSADLERLGGVILIPSWIWLLASVAVAYGFSRDRRFPGFGATWRGLRKHMRRPMIAAFIGLTALTLFVIVVGFVVGAHKGSLRVLPSGIHQVSTLDLHSGAWTTVTPHQYQVWDARFIREDAALAIFALFMIGVSMLFVRVHRLRPKTI